MDIFYPTKYIKKHDFSGRLLIDGDFEDNCLLFRFLFDARKMVHPLLISIKILPLASLKNHSGRYSKRRNKREEKMYVFECNVPDLNAYIMKTRLLFPEFSLKGNKIKVINIESQVSLCLY